MKNKFMLKAMAVLLSSSLLFSSCIGSFNLTKKLHSWNSSINEDKWVNELIFVALCAVQVYSIALFIDGVILNSVEFWTGDNPVDTAQTKQIRTENGLFTITTDAQGHKIQKEGSDEIVAFRFDAQENNWSLEVMGQSTPLVQFVGENQAKVYLADGSTLTVGTDQAGVLALKRAIAGRMYFCSRH
ncbi:MAG: DUF3332 domain-containing protein [Dysgonamonadaceae bacterium]|jgi:hypothetical protein|nr:DUF3332 domain-containing protein [Dysgonamonadaceae bacterium]